TGVCPSYVALLEQSPTKWDTLTSIPLSSLTSVITPSIKFSPTSTCPLEISNDHLDVFLLVIFHLCHFQQNPQQQQYVLAFALYIPPLKYDFISKSGP